MTDREYPTRPLVGIGAVIVISPADGERLRIRPAIETTSVVLIRRRFEPLAGEWTLPGGALEVGETLHAGVAREILEETGLVVEVGPVVDVLDRILVDPDRRVRYHFVLIDYLCRPAGGRLASASDAAEIALVPPAALASYRLTETAERVLRKGLEMAGD